MKLEYGLLVALIASVLVIGLTHLSAELGVTLQSLSLELSGASADAGAAEGEGFES